MNDERERATPGDREDQDPAATLAENEIKPAYSLAVAIAVLFLVVGTVFLTCEVRKRQAGREAARAPSTPEALGLPSMEIAVEIQTVANRILAAWRRDGSPPADLHGLPPDDQDPPSRQDSPARRDPPIDLWGRAYLLSRSENEDGPMLTVFTQGSDGAPGGVNDEQDVFVEIVAPED